MDDHTDEMLRIYSKLTAFRSNYVKVEYVSVEVVSDFDLLIDRLAVGTNQGFKEFKLGGKHFFNQSDKFHDGNAFRAGVDAAINYLYALMPGEAKDRIGYRTS